MGIFDLGFDAPDANGWATRVTPGAADADNLSLAERIRATLTGSTNPVDPKSPVAQGIKAMGQIGGALTPKPQQTQPAAAASPGMPPKPGIDPQLLAKLSSPFAAAPQGVAGGPRPKPQPIYAPFAGTGPAG